MAGDHIAQLLLFLLGEPFKRIAKAECDNSKCAALRKIKVMLIRPVAIRMALNDDFGDIFRVIPRS